MWELKAALTNLSICTQHCDTHETCADWDGCGPTNARNQHASDYRAWNRTGARAKGWAKILSIIG